jgi:outer membrane protein TolC
MVVIRDREDAIIQITARNLEPDYAQEVLEASKAAFEAGARTLRAVIATSSSVNCSVDYR